MGDTGPVRGEPFSPRAPHPGACPGASWRQGPDTTPPDALLHPERTPVDAITYEGSAVNYANAMATTLLFPDTFTPGGGGFGPNFQFAGP
jgi:hypothetical protein